MDRSTLVNPDQQPGEISCSSHSLQWSLLVDDLAAFVVKFCYRRGSPGKLVWRTYSLLDDPAVFLISQAAGNWSIICRGGDSSQCGFQTF
ncbi:MAG: hypothetical protein IBX69_19285 [Anaerolineales bacterium]|nr:hypothetical protein [Anaerolineales bacterium]